MRLAGKGERDFWPPPPRGLASCKAETVFQPCLLLFLLVPFLGVQERSACSSYVYVSSQCNDDEDDAMRSRALEMTEQGNGDKRGKEEGFLAKTIKGGNR